MKPALNLQPVQRLAITPQLKQAIGLLQMDCTELTAALMDAHVKNPLLEVVEPQSDHEPIGEEVPHTPESMDESRGLFNEDWASMRMGGMSSISVRSNTFDGMPENPVGESLHEVLENQLRMSTADPLQKLLADYIVHHLDDAGYLETDLGAILDELQRGLQLEVRITLSDLESALHRVQSLDPVGVGSRTPEECLLLQLSALDPSLNGLQTAKDIVRSCLPLLAKRNFQTIRKTLGVDQAVLCEAIDLIQGLNPHPGYSVGRNVANYVTPDVLLERRDGVWKAKLNMATLPKIVINEDYRKLVTENAENQSFSGLKIQLQDACWLLTNVKKRHDTVLSVASEIVARQQSFFDRGPTAMKPMAMREIAAAVGVHESTVSRAVHGKYIQTPLGTFELRYFFSAEVSAETGKPSSSIAIQVHIRELIASESPARPVSDMKIRQALLSRGYDVARRTVAKYREQMNIPPSSWRKSLSEASKN